MMRLYDWVVLNGEYDRILLADVSGGLVVNRVPATQNSIKFSLSVSILRNAVFVSSSLWSKTVSFFVVCVWYDTKQKVTASNRASSKLVHPIWYQGNCYHTSR